MPHPKKKGSQKRKSKGEVVSHIFPITAAAFPFCTAANNRCRRLENDLASPMICVRRQSSSLKNKKVSGSNGPFVSMATDVKLWHWLRATYLSCLLRSARAASAPTPAPASLVTLGRWKGRVLILCVFTQTL